MLSTPNIAFFSHHKCATTWLSEILARIGELNRRTFRYTSFEDELWSFDAEIIFCGNANYRSVSRAGLSGYHVIRNPLNLIVSAYYSHLATHSTKSWPQLELQRELLSKVNREEGLFLTLTFLEREDFHDRAIGPLLSLRRWDYRDPRFVTLRMEDMVSAPAATLRPLFARHADGCSRLPSGEEMAFSRFADGRAVGEVDNNSHYRSGAADAWRKELPMTIVEYARTRFPDLLEQFYPETLVETSRDSECPPYSKTRLT